VYLVRFRKCIQVRRRRKIQAEIRDSYLEEYMCIKIQSSYRRYLARCRVQRIRYNIANQLLRQAKIHAKHEKKSIIIQRLFRGYLGRKIACQISIRKNIQKNILILQIKAAIIIQCTIRRKFARMNTCRRRFEKRLKLHQWMQVRNIQRVYRGYKGRIQMKNHAIYLQTQSFVSTFITIQRYYRGYKGRQQYKLYLRLKKLKVKELNACINIQRIIRGYLSRTLFQKLYVANKQLLLEIKSAGLIQKVYRGHKGRELLYIFRELTKFDMTISPLTEKLKNLTKKCIKSKTDLDNLISSYTDESNDIEKLDMEIDYVMKTENKYCDSSRLTNYSQRFLTKYLRVRLTEYYEQRKVRNTIFVHNQFLVLHIY